MTASNPDPKLSEAVRSLGDRTYCQSEKYQKQQWMALETGAHVEIIDFRRTFIRRMRKLDVPMYAHNMVRTLDQQKALFVQGVSKTQGAQSPHVLGMAVDIVHCQRHWKLSVNEWIIIGHIGKEVAGQMGIKLIWGGDWGRKSPTDVGWDPAHWELANYRTRLAEAPAAQAYA